MLSTKTNNTPYNLLDDTNNKFEYFGTLDINNTFIEVDFDNYDLFIFLMGFNDSNYGEEKIFSTTIQTTKNLKNVESIPVAAIGTSATTGLVSHIFIDYISFDLKIHYIMNLVKAHGNNDGIAILNQTHKDITCQIYGLKL